MGFIKKAVDKITGKDKAEKRAREEAERARREAEQRAREQAQLEAAQNAATAVAGKEQSESVASADTTKSTEKKKLKAGRKSLTVARAGGNGINL